MLNDEYGNDGYGNDGYGNWGLRLTVNSDEMNSEQ